VHDVAFSDTLTNARSVVSSTDKGRQTDLIFDIGMDAGEDTQFYLAKGFRVVAVEANPQICGDVAKRNAAAISEGRLIIVNRAIAENKEPLTFYVCNTNSAWSTASPRLRDHWGAYAGAAFTEIRVGAVTTSEIIEQFGVPYYAKIDIEGFDIICLRGFARHEPRPHYISIEVDFRNLDEMIRCLRELGYKNFSLVGQRTVPQQSQPHPAREGNAVDYNFTLFSSGLFGRELPTPWGDERHLRSRCNTVIRQYKLNGILQSCARVIPKRSIDAFQMKHLPLSFDWYDLHASL